MASAHRLKLRMPDRVVVRGGKARDAASVLGQIERALEDDGRAALSVYVDEVRAGESALEAAARVAARCVIHSTFQYALVTDVTQLPLTLVDERDDDEPTEHQHAYFSTPLDEQQVKSWIDVLSDPIPVDRED